MFARAVDTENEPLNVSADGAATSNTSLALHTPSKRKPSHSQVLNRLAESKESSNTEDKLKARAYIAQSSLPLVDLIRKQLPSIHENGPSYERVVKLTSAHLLENALSVFECAFERGMKPENIVAVSKCYSNYDKTSQAMQNAGMNVIIQKSIWPAEDGFDDSYELSCAEACVTFDSLLKPNSLPIIFDDGGCLVRQFAKGFFLNRSLLKYAVMIEQTSSGGQSFDKCPTFPKVNMYNSAIKDAESSLVAACSIEKIKAQVNAFAAKHPEFKPFEKSSIGIVGLGKLGMRVAAELVRHDVRELRVFDCDLHQIEKATTTLGIPFVRSADNLLDNESIDEKTPAPRTQVEGMEDASKVFAHSDLVIGVTGFPLIQQGYEAKTLVSRPVIACSLSSRQADFLPWLSYARKLNSKKASARGESYEPEIDFSKPVIVKNGFEGKLAFLRHGTPLTFDNGPAALPPQHAQLTRALIVIAQLQAVEIAMDKETSEKVGKKFINTDYKLSPLWQLFIFKNFLNLIPFGQIERFYTKEEIAKWTNIQSIADLSGGNTYLPFERKTRTWLDSWLKENNLTRVVDQWLDQTQSATAKRAPSPSRLSGRSPSPDKQNNTDSQGIGAGPGPAIRGLTAR